MWSSIFLQYPAFLQRNNEVNLVLEYFHQTLSTKKLLVTELLYKLVALPYIQRQFHFDA